MNKENIAIFYLSTGGGHRSAANAIAAAISELVASGKVTSNPKVLVADIFKKTHPVLHALVNIYNWFLLNHPTKMKYYSWFIDTMEPNRVSLSYTLARPDLFKLLAGFDPQVIVSVHPMINRSMARLIKEKYPGSKLIVVLTDPNGDLWKGWASQDAELIIAPNDLAAKALVDLGIDARKVLTFGMPINPAFLKSASISRADYLAKLGLDPDKLTIVMNPDGASRNRLKKVYQMLSKVSKPVQCILLAGHNKKLMEKLNREVATSSVPSAVLPFLENMADLMSACDLMVTKAGGLTTYEAIARRLPMVIDLLTEPMPQEEGTVRLLIEERMAWPLRQPEDILAIIEQSEPGQRLKLPPDHQLDQVYAVYDIARTIIDCAAL
jgi:UDP-N-acetylglucosamine:LPS N-acetylglucosamine transferase